VHPRFRVSTVLFDLDGTLADTAPDLAYALNLLLEEEGREPLPFARIRNQVSNGSTALVRLGFGEHPEFERLRQRFLEIYSENLFLDSRLFPGMDALLAFIERRGMQWGIVTNKPAFLTDPLVARLGLDSRAACVVSGDTTAQRKPHPEPLFHACRQAGSPPVECVYVGDASRDIEAGRAADMQTLVALYGYIEADERPQEWGATAMIEEPRHILDWLIETQTERLGG
jgi:phosphoglycolate phosphatase